jgi:hypothetical protein
LLIKVNHRPAGQCNLWSKERKMTKAFHAVVWIDHNEARILQLGHGDASLVRVLAPDRVGHLHHKAGTPGPGHAPIDHRYLTKVAQTLSGIARVLIVGPGTARLELASHIREHAPALASNIAGVEPMDRQTDGEIEDYARRYFRRDDRFTP